jgi:hypothetical protein
MALRSGLGTPLSISLITSGGKDDGIEVMPDFDDGVDETLAGFAVETGTSAGLGSAG